MRRRTAALAALCGLLVAAPHAGAADTRSSAPPAPTPRAPVVAVLDSGLRATHREFDYRGPTSAADQVVAWWDFTAETKPTRVLPRTGQLWDTAVADPYDREGHGTLAASLAVGRNRDPRKSPAALPGGRLAVAKVANADGSIESDLLPAAIDWAVSTVHADVISMSISSSAPVPAAAQRPVYDAIAAARRAGVLVVLSNGNGYLNAGLPGDPGWASNYSASTAALAVGAAGSAGYTASTDPEVVAAFTVLGAGIADDTGYVTGRGTSFAAPFVAGYAAALLAAARSAGRALGVEALEQLVKDTATDTTAPPSVEGYGVLSVAELGGAAEHARAGTRPSRPSPDLTGLYVESVAGNLRAAWTA